MRRIFISHRTKDKEIATALRTTLENWGAGQDLVIQQSSDPKSSPVTTGGNLREEIKIALSNADVVMLLYTENDKDWSYCMWECGVATNPRAKEQGELDTNIVVLQCLDRIPDVFEDHLWVQVNDEGINKLTNDFHIREGFFPRHPGAFIPNVTAETLKERSEQLLAKLEAAIAKKRQQQDEPCKMTPQWIRIYLALSLSENDIEIIRRTRDPEKSYDLIKGSIKSNCFVTKETDTHAYGHFDLADAKPRLTLWELFENWRSSQLAKDFAHMDWYTELGIAMVRRVLYKQSLEVEVPLKSAKEQQTWYLPVINAFRAGNSGQDWEFRLELYRIPVSGQYLKINANQQ